MSRWARLLRVGRASGALAWTAAEFVALEAKLADPERPAGLCFLPQRSAERDIRDGEIPLPWPDHALAPAFNPPRGDR